MTTELSPKYRIVPADKRAFWFIIIPALIEGVVVQMFGMIDTLMLGNTTASAMNIAAVSIANAPHGLLVSVSNAFHIGTTTTISYYVGQGKSHKVAAVARQAMLFSLLAGVLLAALMLIFAEPVVLFAGAKDELIAPGVLYFRIVMAAYPMEILTFAATACLRGISVTKIAMIYNVVAGAFNVLGNYTLIYGNFGFPEMGIAGAALSTSISKILAFAIAAGYLLFRDTPVRIRFRESFRFTRDGIGRIASVGVTTGAEQLLLQGGNVIAVKIIATMDTASIAAFNICQTINTLSWKPGGACQVASTTFTARDLGAGDPAKARARTFLAYRYGMYMTVFMSLFLIILHNPVASLFTPEEEIWRIAGRALLFDAVSIAGVTSHLVFSGSLRAAGDQKYTLIASMVSIWTARVFIALLFMHFGVLTATTARLCVSIDQIIRGTIVTIRFLKSDKYRTRPPKKELPS